MRSQAVEQVELAHLRTEGDVVQHRLIGEERVLLRNVAAGTVGLRMFAAVDQDAAAHGTLAAQDQAKQGALAAAGLAEQADEVALVDFEVDRRPAPRARAMP